jgi:predicted porin
MGSEDIGGGLKVNFDLEQGFSADTGAQAVAGNAFSRQSWVGLSGDFGEFRVGKPWTAYDDVSGAINAMFDSGFSVENNFFRSTGYNANPGNTLRYSTPSFGGFSGAFSHSLDEVRNINTDVNSVSLAYAGGPLMAGFGYQTEGLAAGGKTKYTRLSASYDIGAAVIKGLYGNVKSPGSLKTNEYSLGVDVPLSGALTLSGSYGYSKDNAASGDEKAKFHFGRHVCCQTHGPMPARPTGTQIGGTRPAATPVRQACATRSDRLHMPPDSRRSTRLAERVRQHLDGPTNELDRAGRRSSGERVGRV